MALSPLPIKDGSAEAIYTSHTVEHVSEEAVLNLFKEAYRSLKKGGVFRVTTGPDAQADYAALMRGDDAWFYWDAAYVKPGSYGKNFHNPATSVPLEERWLHHVCSQLAPNDISPSDKKYNAEEIKNILKSHTMEDALDFFSSQCSFNPERPGNHITWWTHKKIIDFLKKSGFTNASLSGHGQSSSAVMRDIDLFDSTHPAMSLYVEAIK